MIYPESLQSNQSKKEFTEICKSEILDNMIDANLTTILSAVSNPKLFNMKNMVDESRDLFIDRMYYFYLNYYLVDESDLDMIEDAKINDFESLDFIQLCPILLGGKNKDINIQINKSLFDFVKSIIL